MIMIRPQCWEDDSGRTVLSYLDRNLLEKSGSPASSKNRSEKGTTGQARNMEIAFLRLYRGRELRDEQPT